MIYLVVSIDVEPDCSPDWTYSNPLTFKGVTHGITDILTPLFKKYDIKPTYLINNVVLENQECIDAFKSLDNDIELGTHLHPEFIEPDKSVFDYAGSKGEANCCHYEPNIEFDKIKNITNLFYDKFGYLPTSFRAGRFSASNNTFNSLSLLGYKIDTSITPGVSWNDRTRLKPVDFSEFDNNPFWINNQLLEIPVTILKESHFSIKELIKSGFGIKRKPRFYKNIWLRPVFSDTQKLLEIVERIEQSQNNISVLNLMFHNVEIMPNLSPYCKTIEDCEKYLKSLESLFSLCNNKGIQSIKISELYEIYRK